MYFWPLFASLEKFLGCLEQNVVQIVPSLTIFFVQILLIIAWVCVPLQMFVILGGGFGYILWILPNALQCIALYWQIDPNSEIKFYMTFYHFSFCHFAFVILLQSLVWSGERATSWYWKRLMLRRGTQWKLKLAHLCPTLFNNNKNPQERLDFWK